MSTSITHETARTEYIEVGGVRYAYRRLGSRGFEPWRIFLASEVPASGSIRFICRRLPPVSTTRGGHGILRWAEGMPLSKFLDMVRGLIEPTSGVAK